MNLRNLALFGLVAVLFPAFAVCAQVSTFRADVPFPFVVENQTLPPATYIVQRFLGKPQTASEMGVIVIKSSGHHVYKVIVTAAVQDHHAARPQGSRLVFTRFEGKQYLNCIWVAGDSIAYHLSDAHDDSAPNESGEVIVTALKDSRRK